MDNSKRLEQSIKNFDQEIDKLSKINQLTNEISQLVTVIEQEKKILEKSITQLNTMKVNISEDCKILSKYVENESEERKKLTADVHNVIIKDTQQIINEILQPLKLSNNELANSSENIKKFIETHKNSQEKFMAAIEAVLIKYNTKNLDVYNNLMSNIDNKINLLKSDTDTNLDKKYKAIEKNMADLNDDFDKSIKNMNEEFTKSIQKVNSDVDNISSDVQKIKKNADTLNYLKVAVTIAIVIGIIDILMNFLI